MYAIYSHSYTHLIQALGIVREPTVWRFITSKYPGIHDTGLPICSALYAKRATPRRDLRWNLGRAPPQLQQVHEAQGGSKGGKPPKRAYCAHCVR